MTVGVVDGTNLFGFTLCITAYLNSTLTFLKCKIYNYLCNKRLQLLSPSLIPRNDGLRAEVKKDMLILTYYLMQERVETTLLCPLLYHSLRKTTVIPYFICITKNRNDLLVSGKKKCSHQEKVYD